MKTNLYFKSLILLIVSFSIISCVTQNKIEKSGVTSLEFGSGGGFTGKYVTYILDLKQKTLNAPDNVKTKVKAKDLKELLKMLEDTDFAALKQDEPGNMNEFLTISTAQPIKFVWEKNSEIPIELKALYLKLKTLTIDEKK